MTNSIRKIKFGKKLLGIVIRRGYTKSGVYFPTPENLTLQVGVHNRRKGDEAKPHRHLVIQKLVNVPILEVFFVVRGKMRVNFFDNKWKKIKSVLLKSGDVFVNTTTSPHSVKFLTKTKMIEVKQGPYFGKQKDKILK